MCHRTMNRESSLRRVKKVCKGFPWIGSIFQSTQSNFRVLTPVITVLTGGSARKARLAKLHTVKVTGEVKWVGAKRESRSSRVAR